MREEIHKAWLWFEQECLYSKNYALLPMMCAGMPGPAPSNPAIDRIFPTLLLIKGLAILDTAFRDKIQDDDELRGKPTNSGQRVKDLYTRTELLNEHGLLLNATGVHGAREVRKFLAHDYEEYVDWENFERHIEVIRRELAHISAIGEIPNFSVTAERGELRECTTDPDADYERKISINILSDGRIVSEVSIVQKLMKDHT